MNCVAPAETIPGGVPVECIEAILSEDPSSVRAREESEFDRLAGAAARSLVLFGAGPLGRFTLAGLDRYGIRPLCFSDNNSALWGKPVDGLTVLSPADAVERYRDTACFVVTIYNGSPVRRQLQQMNCPRVSPFAPLFWKFADTFIPESGLELPHRILAHAAEIRECCRILADEQSRSELYQQLRWRCLLDYDCMSPPAPAPDMHFAPDLLRPLAAEVFVDCGAFDGDSIRAFLARRGDNYRHVYALEPDPVNREALRRSIGQIPGDSKITILPFAASNRGMRAGFDATGSVISKLTESAATSYVECRRLDELLATAGPTHIKMDIEGAEPEAIEGAAGLFRKARPAVSACAYHRSEHLWRLPLLIHTLAPDYKIFLRRYAEECWEMVCYGVPAERLRGTGKG